jgi:hypothetical protein
LCSPILRRMDYEKIPKRVFNFSFDARLLKVFAHHGVYGEFLRMLNSAMCSQRVHISNVQLLRKRDRNGQVHPHAPWIFLPIHHFCTFCLDSWKSPYLDRRCLVVQLYSWCAPQTLSSLWLGKIWCPSQVSYPFIFAHPFQKMQVLKIVLLKSATVRWPCIASALRSLYPTPLATTFPFPFASAFWRLSILILNISKRPITFKLARNHPLETRKFNIFIPGASLAIRSLPSSKIWITNS